MQNHPQLPSHVNMDQFNQMLISPESFAAKPESLTEQLFVERSLTENKFWLRIMKEHSLFLGEGFNRKDTHLIQQTDRFYHYFEQQEKKAYQTPNNVELVRKLNEESIDLVHGFRNFKRNLLILIINCKISGFNFPLLVDHIAREAEYFMRTLNKFNKGILDPIQDAIITENVFWIRIMMEHSRFIASLLDQSERNLVITARKFGDDFETLLNQARDVESMLYRKQPTYPIIGKLNNDSENAAQEILAFKKAGLELIKSCQIRNVISPLLADHVVREAEHFLYMIHILENRLNAKKKAEQ
ncbi:protein of unknown function (DUF2935) [Schinkia azotoformans MEV2011]|uniref:DUF2935 domain-containing protein n=1 Tax=Schinkia azotoformans MEV2011 TaxID=1348973 RepID=A0A072NL56_SCHAZ|nr:DUF2935 domain-containing protein [Schinkia azotoformans]KEF38424.1 protein of unknown function (DUF2935) [Schinkia azotoformans MEV2011]MEC1694166.1 DUF2935 domain-containing protein [Schinkia azotoformans]MEC1724828.1 DUF2935 domain-containing protein [Schinkia azotoformans]MEC1780908.1 DUF2935 domain-containing protein [Schinkia azotoformans]MED4330566.1 DUF2935 domain-containing protein [Schinkia azotoformans]